MHQASVLLYLQVFIVGLHYDENYQELSMMTNLRMLLKKWKKFSIILYFCSQCRIVFGYAHLINVDASSLWARIFFEKCKYLGTLITW